MNMQSWFWTSGLFMVVSSKTMTLLCADTETAVASGLRHRDMSNSMARKPMRLPPENCHIVKAWAVFDNSKYIDNEQAQIHRT